MSRLDDQMLSPNARACLRKDNLRRKAIQAHVERQNIKAITNAALAAMPARKVKP